MKASSKILVDENRFFSEIGREILNIGEMHHWLWRMGDGHHCVYLQASSPVSVLLLLLRCCLPHGPYSSQSSMRIHSIGRTSSFSSSSSSVVTDSLISLLFTYRT